MREAYCKDLSEDIPQMYIYNKAQPPNIYIYGADMQNISVNMYNFSENPLTNREWSDKLFLYKMQGEKVG